MTILIVYDNFRKIQCEYIFFYDMGQAGEKDDRGKIIKMIEER